MNAHFKYLSYVCRHKWWVFVAGLKTGAPLWRLVVHDWSKFLPVEWGPYVANFYAPKPVPAYGDARNHGGLSPVECERIMAERKAAFDRAWLHHQHANAHHWQHWLLMEDNPPAYPSYHITSPDGVGQYNSLTEYTGPYEPGSAQPISADFTEVALSVGGGAAADERYRMVKRACDAANARRPKALPMPEHLIREMVADWMGAGRAITGKWEAAEWYAKNRHKMALDPGTRARVEALLSARLTPEPAS